jgi:hypothetical protein
VLTGPSSNESDIRKGLRLPFESIAGPFFIRIPDASHPIKRMDYLNLDAGTEYRVKREQIGRINTFSSSAELKESG